MVTKVTKTHMCDRCGAEQVGQVGLDFSGGYVSFGPVNGCNSEHVGVRWNKDKSHADLCETCRKTLLKWWRRE